jgi:twitching motility protein PilT
MARLDTVIDRLFRESALELVFQSATAPFMQTHRGRVDVLRHALTADQIILAVREILPEELRNGFPREGTTRFSYRAPAGPVRVRMDRWEDRIRVTLAPEMESEEGVLGVFGDEGSHAPPAVDEGDAAQAEIVLETEDPPEPAHASSNRPRAATVSAVSPATGTKEITALLTEMLQRKASDLHLSSETIPMFRIDGDISPRPSSRPIPAALVKEMIWSIAPERNREEWEKRKDTDFAYETPGARFRVNVFADRKGIGAVIRQIPAEVLTAEQLGLSKAVLELCQLQKGLVLVTGPTGSGKSTTLAAMIDHVNRTRSDHVITIEDPIEFVHPNRKCLMNQREVGTHTDSFKQALRAALREDPDVILVGELRDLETISIAIETAETGHLVFGTLHTNTAPSTVDRIIDQFPPDRQAQIRTMLSESLKGVIAQTLCKKIGGGRVAAQEILLCNGGVSNMIREGKTFQLPSVMQTGRGAGMVTLNDALLELAKKSVVTPEEAVRKSVARAELKGMLERAGIKIDAAAAEQRAA